MTPSTVTYSEQDSDFQKEFAKKHPERAKHAKGQPMSSVLWRAPATEPNKFADHVQSGQLLDVRDAHGRWIRP
jgi:mRNA-degrading endonuclease YafQ of YafQ-DinJ toxin-antitoxin module